jgi:hypothetical protein
MTQDASDSAAFNELCTVTLVGYPLAVWARSQEHADELIREFTLIALDSGESEHHTPARLLALVDQLTGQYGTISAQTERIRDDAVARGEDELDLVYELPASAAEACRALGDMLDEADEFCRRGEHLLTLATPPEAVRFRRWFLDEMIAQLGGAEPVPWRDYAAAHALR